MPERTRKPVCKPAPEQAVYFYEEPEESLTATLWQEDDPYLVGLWQQGKVFASYDEARAAQAKEQADAVKDWSEMRISELIAFAETQARIEQEHPPFDDPDRDASWAATLEMLRLMKERGVPEPLQDK